MQVSDPVELVLSAVEEVLRSLVSFIGKEVDRRRRVARLRRQQ